MEKLDTKHLSVYYVGSGMVFILYAMRNIYAFDSLAEWGIFITICIGIVVSLQSRVLWIAFYYYLIALFYNPLVLSKIHARETLIADVLIGFSFFLIGLHWRKFITNKN